MKKDMIATIATYKEQIYENIDLMIGEETTGMEVMCSYLRVIDALSQLYVFAEREAIRKERER